MKVQNLGDAKAGLVEVVRLIEASEHRQAMALLDDLEHVFTVYGQPDRLTAVQQRRAMLWAITGKLEDAIRCNEDLAEVFANEGDRLAEGRVRVNLGYNFRVAQQVSRAEEQYLRALSIFESVGTFRDVATCYMNLASMLGGERPESAKTYILFARHMFEFGNEPKKAGDCLLIQARFLDRDEPDSADRIRLQAQDSFERLGDQTRAGQARYARAGALIRRSLLPQAEDLLREALRIFLSGNPPTVATLADTARLLSEVLAARGAYQQAWDYAVLAVSILNGVRSGLTGFETRRSWASSRQGAYVSALNIALLLKDPAKVMELIEVARASQAPAAGHAPDLDPSAKRVLNASITLAPIPAFTVHGRRQVDPARARTRVHRDLGIGPPSTSAQLTHHPSTDLDLTDLVTRIGGTPAIWWSTVRVGEELYWSCSVGSAVSAGKIPFGPDSPLRSAVETLSGLIPSELNPDREHYRSGHNWLPGGPADRTLATISDLLVPHELSTALETKAAPGLGANLVIAADSALARIPFGLLHTSPTSRPLRLIESAPLIMCPSPAIAGQKLRTTNVKGSRGRRALSVAVVDPLGDLPSTRALARGATQRLGTSARPPGFGGPKRATIAALNKALEARSRHQQHDSDVVIIATHSTPGVDEDPTAAAFKFADGDLTAKTLLEAESPARFPLPARVMFASCTSAGLGRAEWFGLTAAAGHLGAQWCVASLWPLATGASTRRLDMNLLSVVRSAHDLSHGLRQVQLRGLSDWRSSRRPRAIVRLSGRSHPLDWAAYVLVAV